MPVHWSYAVSDGLLTPSSDDATVIVDFESYDPASQDHNDPKLPPHEPTKTKGMVDYPVFPTHAQQPVVLPPYIIVLYNDKPEARTAWGRDDIANIGYHTSARLIFDAYILHPSRAPKRKFSLFEKTDRAIFWKAYKYLRADFVTRVKFRPQFAIGSSGSNGTVNKSLSLQPMGWREMVQSVVSIRVDYQIPDTYPGKADVERILKQVPKEA